MSRAKVFAAIRAARGRGWPANDPQIGAIDTFLDGIGVPRDAPVPVADPAWMVEARRLIGQREIRGPQHNGLIATGWARLGAPWFNDDETPWCGWFVAHCMDAAGLPYPGKGEFARALAWAGYGKPVSGVPGAILVFGRDGGGHVGFYVGEDDAAYHVLGGNQGNAVSIARIAKARLVGIRWPTDVAVTGAPVRMKAIAGVPLSRNEA